MKKLATEEREGMSLIVGTVTHWVCAFIVLSGSTSSPTAT